MTDVQFTAAITHDGAWYVARALQVEVTSQGETVESALANLREALELYFKDEPLPLTSKRPSRAPRDLHSRLPGATSTFRCCTRINSTISMPLITSDTT